MDEPLITLEALSIGYNSQPVMSAISFSIQRGSFTAILGANGSGKSTLLKTLLGLQPAISGRIRIAGAPMIFGYVPQTIQFDPLYLLTGLDVALMGVYQRVGPGRFVPPGERAFVRECLTATGAEGFARQRFARALATRPTVLVLDEPTAGVDAAATHALLEFISRIHKEQKLTILLVTHDLPLVRKHAQQIVWLHQGRVLTGAAAELLSPERMAEILEMEIC
jgi:ABC-type Mn2+/Zn2+ transport system ATPase subunit